MNNSIDLTTQANERYFNTAYYVTNFVEIFESINDYITDIIRLRPIVNGVLNMGKR